MKYYYIALGIWILKILMWVTIILIPVERYLKDRFDYWHKPFLEGWDKYVNNL